MVSKQTTQRRRRNSKRQKRRSLKRRNVKSRKVMRGGTDDPLKYVKKDDLVSVVLKEKVADLRDYNPTINDETVKCRVLEVDPSYLSSPKVVKLVITDEEKITFCYVYGGNLNNGIPMKHRKEFYISYTPSDDKTCPYKLIIYQENEKKELKVIPERYYTHIIPEGHTGNLVNSLGYEIKSVQPLTASQ